GKGLRRSEDICSRIDESAQRIDSMTFLPSRGFHLKTHKEVEWLISGFFREIFLKRPDNILQFAADYFTDPRLPNKIHMQLIKDKRVA
uniref:Regulatory subunit of type II PKA R-subunit domain containing 1 n=1 Tax=Cebus imitator TaxID=2715852 RepID=A0A2K5RM64_CEBIM